MERHQVGGLWLCGGGDKEWEDGCEMCKRWRGGLDSSCEKKEEEEC